MIVMEECPENDSVGGMSRVMLDQTALMLLDQTAYARDVLIQTPASMRRPGRSCSAKATCTLKICRRWTCEGQVLTCCEATRQPCN